MGIRTFFRSLDKAILNSKFKREESQFVKNVQNDLNQTGSHLAEIHEGIVNHIKKQNPDCTSVEVIERLNVKNLLSIVKCNFETKPAEYHVCWFNKDRRQIHSLQMAGYETHNDTLWVRGVESNLYYLIGIKDQSVRKCDYVSKFRNGMALVKAQGSTFVVSDKLELLATIVKIEEVDKLDGNGRKIGKIKLLTTSRGETIEFYDGGKEDNTMKVIGSYVVSNNTSVNIYCILHGTEDKVIFSWNNGKKSHAKIRYDVDGNPYFKTKGIDIPFNQVMRA